MNRRLARKVLEGMLDLVLQKSTRGGHDGPLVPLYPSPQETDLGVQAVLRGGPLVTVEESDSWTMETGLWMLFWGGLVQLHLQRRNGR